ncbi:4-coumarate--CoA ligase family protein [Silicimonas algicola]|uniref:4-coumarate--CoA ligase n=1 Tax=Silicimonas algicola TaxID=1826607 RepID=A0A316GCR9_9RHOB|nr:acyl--CoA ligase [Silicimonas algicola]AZQ66406.1 4-coumarate--CoA ligase family protein [Silicimonas algicola]PWK58741.1 4-coumarate--CoA ligase [Silicimonas algicola]
MIFESRYPRIAPSDMTVTDRVFQGLESRPDETVIVCGVTGRSLTASALMDRIRRFAGGLEENGFARETVAIMSTNHPDYPVVFHGTAFAGGTVTTANPTYTARELNYQLTDSGASLLVVHPDFLATATEAAKGTGIRRILTLGDAEAEGATPIDAFLGAPRAAQAEVDLDTHVVALPYSSGTTGLPKGVMLSHRNISTNVDQSLGCLSVQPGEWTVAFLPFFHIYGQTLLMNVYLARGANIVTLPRFDLKRFLELVQEYRTPRIWGVPPVAIALAKHPTVDDYDLSSVKWVFSAAAPADETLMNAVRDRIGAQGVQAYGMTELSPISHVAAVEGAKPGAAGVAAPSTDCRIVDPETQKDRGPNEEGELWIRGPQVMRGYHNNPKATAETITEDGWLRTGDLGLIDNDGELWIRDRLKELIKYKGFQVAPAEVEAALLELPDVADCAVLGKRDDEAGEVPVAFVVRAPGSEASPDDIRAALDGRLVSYKIPAEVTFIDAIPKTASGKILRRQLRDR